MIRRLSLFLLGLSMGLVVLAFFFRGKGVQMCYFPNCRVLKELRSKPLEMGKGIQKERLEEVKPLFYKGDVDFSRSDVKSNICKKYIIEGQDNKGQNVEIEVENCDKSCILRSIKVIN